jgi:hypothetical protein
MSPIPRLAMDGMMAHPNHKFKSSSSMADKNEECPQDQTSAPLSSSRRTSAGDRSK